jgi:hypothetical protein
VHLRILRGELGQSHPVLQALREVGRASATRGGVTNRIQTSRGPPEVRPTAWRPRSGLIRRSPHKVSEKRNTRDPRAAKCALCGERDDAESWAGIPGSPSVSTGAARHNPNRRTAAGRVLFAFKPEPPLSYVGRWKGLGA